MSNALNFWVLLAVPALVITYVLELRWATTPDRVTKEIAAKPAKPVDRPVEDGRGSAAR